MAIITNKIRDLVHQIEGASRIDDSLQNNIRELVARLRASCANSRNIARYRAYDQANNGLGKLPVDGEGYIRSFDVLREESDFYECWRKYGIVVSRGAASEQTCSAAVRRMHEVARALSGGKCDLRDPATWSHIPTDANGVSLISRGFFELYHDDVLAQLRQSVRVYLHYVLLWGTPELWTSFDRLGAKLPGHEESRALPLHVDQNPNVHPLFRTVQGVLALTDCPAERGTFVGVPGSKNMFRKTYADMAQNTGEYVELDMGTDVAKLLQAHAQICPLRQGNLISWDSRTTHANSENVSDKMRAVAYIAAGRAREDDESLVQVRAEALRTAVGSNVRDALMHASKPPRFSNHEAINHVRTTERLNLLGELLYGQARYAHVSAKSAAKR